jgi:hypothetical protein
LLTHKRKRFFMLKVACNGFQATLLVFNESSRLFT